MIDIDYLLIILPSIILLGVFGLILIIWHGNFRKNKDKVKLARDNPEKKSARIIDSPTPSRLEPTLKELPKKEVKPQQAIHSFIDNFIILQVIAAKDRPYRGYELMQTLTSAGFHYGKMNIFHYQVADTEESKETLFSLASAIEPGTFDLDHIGEIVCPGLCLFMSINKVKSPLSAFEIMLETAQMLIQDLGGTLCDKHLQALRLDDLSHYYSQLHSYA